MVNVCIAIGIEENISILKTLSLESDHHINSNILGYYRLGAISTATGILRNYRKAMKKNPRTMVPIAGKLMLTACYRFKIENNHFRVPIKPRHYVYVKLNNYTLKV